MMHNRLFSYLFACLLFASVASCGDNTDLNQLWDDEYAPTFELKECSMGYEVRSSHRIIFNLNYEYSTRVKRVAFYIGQNRDSVMNGLSRRYYYNPQSDKTGNFRIRVDSLMPSTTYYSYFELEDYGGTMHPGKASEHQTKAITMHVAQPEYRNQNPMVCFNDVSETTMIGFEQGYDPDLKDATVTQMLAREAAGSYNGYSHRIECPNEDFVPRHPYYIRPFAIYMGHQYYGEKVEMTSQRFTLVPNVVAHSNNLNVVVRAEGTYVDKFTIGFYIADHPITPDNLGTRYVVPALAQPIDAEGLRPSTTYYVRAFCSDGTHESLFDERAYTTLNGFVGDECDIQIGWYGGPFYLRFIRVEPGTFTMGATPAQVPYAEADEYPAHEVTIDHPYYMAQVEIDDEMKCMILGWNGGYTNHAETVYYEDAEYLLENLRQKTQLNGFRLPTEAEWEYAARGGHKAKGDYLYAGSNDYATVAADPADAEEYWYTTDLKTKQPNALGLYDMSGNAAEWCSDWYAADYYSVSPSVNPQGPASGTKHVVRGGDRNPYRPQTDARVSNRWAVNPAEVGRDNSIGLRIVYDPSADE